MKQRILLLIPLLFLCGFLYAQNDIVSPDKTGAWILDQTVSQVDFYHMINECNGEKLVFIKLFNRNTYPVKVAWDETVATQLETARSASRGKKSLIVQSGKSLNSDCNSGTHKELVTLSSEVSPAYVAIISKFNFQNITVERVN